MDKKAELETLKKQYEFALDAHSRKFSANVNETLYQESAMKLRNLHAEIGKLSAELGISHPIWF